jgi:hypothetical protein
MSAFPLSIQELKMPALQNTFKAELIVSVWPAPYCAEVGDIRKVCS